MEVTCATCAIRFNKTLTQIKRSKTGNHFCSKSCAARTNNKLFQKRPKTFFCSVCKKPREAKTVICMECKRKQAAEAFGDQPISNFLKDHRKNRYEHIRQHAHRVAKFHELPRRCPCGYTKAVDLCHIKAIGEFPKETLLSVVNSKENLVFLCKNHHWELDHGLLDSDMTQKLGAPSGT